MKVTVPNGRYVIAVSGGVDSMVLLDLLANQVTGDRLQVRGKKPNNSQYQPIVAHFNHGIRSDSAQDEALVKHAAAKYGLKYETTHGHLGIKASEELARLKRYKFLNSLKNRYQARAIITAHHQDDLIETAFINALRGTGRKGLTSMDNPEILRPLLPYPKTEIVKYAKTHNLSWREDPTNQNADYLRNYLRLSILPNLNKIQRQRLLGNIGRLKEINQDLDKHIANLSHKITKNNQIDRLAFAALPLEIEKELMHFWLRQNQIPSYTKQLINRLILAIKTGQPGRQYDINNHWKLTVKKKFAYFSPTD